MCCSVTSVVACSKCDGVGRSWASWPGTPVFGQHPAGGRRRLRLRSGAQHRVYWPMRGTGAVGVTEGPQDVVLGRRHPDPVPVAARRARRPWSRTPTPRSGSARPARRRGGRSPRCSASPWWSTVSPFQSSRMTWRASAQHLLADLDRRPPLPEHVLVERLAGADAEEEAALEEQGRRRRRLGDDRRVDAQDRAGHAGPDADGRRRLGHAAEDRPHERAVALLVDPRVEVVRDRQEVEARLLGQARMAHQVGRSVLLAGECVAPRGHGPSSTPGRGPAQPEADGRCSMFGPPSPRGRADRGGGRSSRSARLGAALTILPPGPVVTTGPGVACSGRGLVTRPG